MPRLPRPPFWMVSLALIFMVATWLPLAIIARAQAIDHDRTADSARCRTWEFSRSSEQQMTNPLFADDRAMRPPVPGTVARGSLEGQTATIIAASSRQNDGNGKWTVVFRSIPCRQGCGYAGKDARLLQRGQQRFNIYCYVCHGYDGSGHGPVNQRAVELKRSTPIRVTRSA